MFYVVLHAVFGEEGQERQEVRVSARLAGAVSVFVVLEAVIQGEWVGLAERDPEDRALAMLFWVTRVDEAAPAARGSCGIAGRKSMDGLDVWLRACLDPIW